MSMCLCLCVFVYVPFLCLHAQYNLKEQLYEGVVDPLVELVAVLLHGADNSKSEFLGQTEATFISSADASCYM